MKELYIIRHGETDYNKQGLIQGRRVDADLNETGRLQARLFYENYRHIAFDKIYTSTLKRTHQTVQGFLDQGISWEQLPGLDEMDWGNSEGLKVEEDGIQDEFYAVTRSWVEGDYHARYRGGESAMDVAERQWEAMEQILARPLEKNVLICMHGRAMRLLICSLAGRELKEMDQFPHQNLSLYKVAQNGKGFDIIEFNNVEHLNGL